MPGYTLVPVDYQPDFGDYSLVPVAYDPFPEDGATQQAQVQQAQQPATGVDQPGVDPSALTIESGGSSPLGTTGLQQISSAQSCNAAHRACLLSGRDSGICRRALWNCVGRGLPTIFGPGIVGAPG